MLWLHSPQGPTRMYANPFPKSKTHVHTRTKMCTEGSIVILYSDHVASKQVKGSGGVGGHG